VSSQEDFEAQLADLCKYLYENDQVLRVIISLEAALSCSFLVMLEDPKVYLECYFNKEILALFSQYEISINLMLT